MVKKMILAAAAIAISSSAAFAQYHGLSTLNVDQYWFYNGQGANIHAQARPISKAHHVSKKSSAKRAAVGQTNKM